MSESIIKAGDGAKKQHGSLASTLYRDRVFQRKIEQRLVGSRTSNTQYFSFKALAVSTFACCCVNQGSSLVTFGNIFSSSSRLTSLDVLSALRLSESRVSEAVGECILALLQFFRKMLEWLAKENMYDLSPSSWLAR